MNTNSSDNLSLLLELERWVLPPTDQRLLLPIQRQRKASNLCDRPLDRLNEVMFRLQFCDHLRIVQGQYDDSEDQQRLISEWREKRDDAKLTMSTKVLQDKLLEGRCRVMALIRMCYGEESLESIRALVDLAGANALLGLWVPMQEHLTIATTKLTHLCSPTEILQRAYRRRKSYHAASLVDCCYRILREHALAQRGQVTPMYVRQLDEALKKVRTQGLEEIALLKEMNPAQEYDDEYDFIVTPNQIKEIITEVYTFIERYMHDKKKPSSTFRSISPTNGRISPDLIPLKPSHKTYPSWGDMISFLRTDCEVVLFWIDEMQLSSLPQDISALHLSFRVCDEQNRGIAHPMQLNQTIVQFTNALKAMSYTSLRSYLEQTKVEVPLWVNQKTGLAMDISTGSGLYNPNSNHDFDDNNMSDHGGFRTISSTPLRIVYELPVAWEEVLSQYILQKQIHTQTLQDHYERRHLLRKMSPKQSPRPTSSRSPSPSSPLTLKDQAISLLDQDVDVQIVKAQILLLQGLSNPSMINTPFRRDLFIHLHKTSFSPASYSINRSSESTSPSPYLSIPSLNYELPSTHLYTGLSNMTIYKFDLAEDLLKSALKHLEKVQLDNELVACDVYDALARTYLGRRKRRAEVLYLQLRKQAYEWAIADESGKRDVRTRVAAIVAHYHERKAGYNLTDLEVRGRNAAIKAKVARLLSKEPDPTFPTIEEASRLLLLNHEILTRIHGTSSNITVVHACISLGQVFDVLGQYNHLMTSTTWYKQAINLMNQLSPVPVRILAVTQLQLSAVLAKFGTVELGGLDFDYLISPRIEAQDESMKLLTKATEFYHNQAQMGLIGMTEYTDTGPRIPHPPKKGQLLFDDIHTAVELLTKLVNLHAQAGHKDEAALYAHQAAELTECSFDWDSLLTAEARKDSGVRFALLDQWGKACVALRKSYEAFAVVCGTGDKRTAQVAKLLAVALDNRLRYDPTYPLEPTDSTGYRGASVKFAELGTGVANGLATEVAPVEEAIAMSESPTTGLIDDMETQGQGLGLESEPRLESGIDRGEEERQGPGQGEGLLPMLSPAKLTTSNSSKLLQAQQSPQQEQLPPLQQPQDSEMTREDAQRYNDDDDFEEQTLQETSYRQEESSSYHEYDSEIFA